MSGWFYSCPMCLGVALKVRRGDYWVKQCQMCGIMFGWTKGEQVDVVTTDTTEPKKEVGVRNGN